MLSPDLGIFPQRPHFKSSNFTLSILPHDVLSWFDSDKKTNSTNNSTLIKFQRGEWWRVFFGIFTLESLNKNWGLSWVLSGWVKTLAEFREGWVEHKCCARSARSWVKIELRYAAAAEFLPLTFVLTYNRTPAVQMSVLSKFLIEKSIKVKLTFILWTLLYSDLPEYLTMDSSKDLLGGKRLILQY